MSERVGRVLSRLGERDLLDTANRIARERGVAVGEMIDIGCRRREPSAARHELWAALKRELRMSAREIGEIFETRDNSTVLRAVPDVKAKRTREGLESRIAEQIASFLEREGQHGFARAVREGKWKVERKEKSDVATSAEAGPHGSGHAGGQAQGSHAG